MTLSPLFLVATLLPGVAPQTGPRDVSAILEEIRARHDVAGLAGVILSEGEITASGAAGVRRLGHPEPVTVDNRWHIGSCTKAITATALARLVERGRLAWDDSLGGAFGDVAKDWHADYRAVTVRRLLDHTAGLPRDFPFASHMASAGYTGERIAEGRRRVMQAILVEAPAGEVGERAYSNVGYVLAGHLIETITGSTWEAALRDLVFAPLAMTSAGFGPPGEPGTIDQPWGHTEAGIALEPKTPGSDLPQFYGPAGLVHVTLADWARFVAFHLRPARVAPELLEAETVRFLHTPIGDAADYACGWGVTTRAWATGPVLAHSGSNRNWFACVWMSPDDDFAVLIVCNQGGTAAAKACDEAAGALIGERASQRARAPTRKGKAG